MPFLTALVLSERSCRERGRRHKPLLSVGRQHALQVRRWLPGRDLILVGDGGFSALLSLDAMQRARITAITRLRLYAALYNPTPPRPPGTTGRPRTKGARLDTLAPRLAAKDTRWREVVVPGWHGAGERAHNRDRLGHRGVAARGPARRADPMGAHPHDPEARFPTQALLCTDPTCEPAQIVGWFVRRWTIEVTFQETRVHLGVETQRQWSDAAIARITPCLLTLFSIITLLAAQLPARQRRRVAAAAWYPKPRPAFADALAAVRFGARGLWQHHRADAPEQNLASGCPRPGPKPSATPHIGQSRAQSR